MPRARGSPDARGHQPHPTGGPGRPLHIGSHNVGGRLVSDRVHAATSAALWRRERLDVVAVQETFVDASNTDLASKWLLELGYTVFWNTKRLVNSDGTRARRCGGTAIAILSSLLAGGEDAVLRISNLVFSDDGRLTSIYIGSAFTTVKNDDRRKYRQSIRRCTCTGETRARQTTCCALGQQIEKCRAPG